MTTGYLLLAVLMAAVTYPARALPLLTSRLDRLPAGATAYLQLVGPAALGALAATTALVATTPGGGRSLHVDVTAVSVVACVAVVAWRRSLFTGLLVAVAVAAAARNLPLG